MGRLTKLIDDEWRENHDNDTRYWKNGSRACMNLLAEYENTDLAPAEVAELAKAKADGRLVVMPCKRGDVVYFIKSAFSIATFPIEAKVTSIRGIDCDGAVMYNAVTSYNKLDRRFTSNDIGKTVFLIEIEAQTELKRMENENGMAEFPHGK